MSLADKNRLFANQYLSQTDNVFEAINQFAHDASTLCDRTQNRLSKSEALNSALTGDLPDSITERKIVVDVEHQYVDKYIDQVLNDIDDVSVRISVKESLTCSRYSKNLTYRYYDGLSSGQKSRVRVICKMIWFSLFRQKG